MLAGPPSNMASLPKAVTLGFTKRPMARYSLPVGFLLVSLHHPRGGTHARENSEIHQGPTLTARSLGCGQILPRNAHFEQPILRNPCWFPPETNPQTQLASKNLWLGHSLVETPTQNRHAPCSSSRALGQALHQGAKKSTTMASRQRGASC